MDTKFFKVVVTAGPTREPLDPMRYLSNHSSGKMGYAVAQAAQQLGAQVELISGPTTLPCPPHVNRTMVTTAEEMHAAVINQLPCDIFIGAAAVADYKPEFPQSQKIKRHDSSINIKLIKTPDILEAVTKNHPRSFIVGFAAETENMLANAKNKLHQKNIDIIAANQIGPGMGYDVDENALTILTRSGKEIVLPKMSKQQLAEKLLQIIITEWQT